MIKLKKGEVPPILARNSDQWTKSILDKLGRGETPTNADKSHYAHQEIKTALVAETHGKCAYCESKLRHITYGDIEHIVPKSIVPARWFDWDNLTLACDICNGRKSDFHGNHDTFIDPYSVDPEEHFWILGATVWSRPGSDAAAITERLLDLNRIELTERRKERLQGLRKHLDVVMRVTDLNLKTTLWEDFLQEAHADKEFAALAREVVRLARAKLGVQ